MNENLLVAKKKGEKNEIQTRAIAVKGDNEGNSDFESEEMIKNKKGTHLWYFKKTLSNQFQYTTYIGCFRCDITFGFFVIGTHNNLLMVPLILSGDVVVPFIIYI